MSNFDRFRNMMNTEDAAREAAQLDKFINDSVASTTITLMRTGKNMRGVLITAQDEDGADETILFVKNANSAADIKTGDYIIDEDNSIFLLYKKYRITSKLYLKFKAIECNTYIKVDDIIQPTYYISSLRKFIETIDTKIDGGILQIDGSKPLLVTTYNNNFNLNKRIMINGEAFKIIGIDKYSTKNIMYLSIVPTQVNFAADDLENGVAKTPPKPINVIEPIELASGDIITMSTNYGYTNFNHEVKVINKTINSITFEVPYGIDELVVKTKNTEGDIIINKYKVVV